MQAVIFAAGLGMRLRPLTDMMPKALVPVAGQAVLARTLDQMPERVDEVIIVVGYKGEMIRQAIGHDSRVRFVEQPELRGTHDSLMRAVPLLNDAPFLVLNGDDLYGRDDLTRLSEADPFTMLAKRIGGPGSYSRLDIEDGRLVRIADAKGLTEPRLVYVGAACLDPRFLSLEPAMAPNGELGLPHTLERHAKTFPVRVIEAAFWMPVGTPEELAAANLALA